MGGLFVPLIGLRFAVDQACTLRLHRTCYNPSYASAAVTLKLADTAGAAEEDNLRASLQQCGPT